MTDTIRGLTFDAPSGWDADEVMVSFRAPPSTLVDPRALQKQFPIRGNLMVHRRRVGDVPLEVLAGEVTAELVNAIVGIQDLTTERFAFDDGRDGVVVGFAFPAPEAATARQYQALRVDDGVLSILTLTVDGARLDHERDAWMKCLRSARPSGNF